MILNEGQFKELLVRYQQHRCSTEEKAQLEHWLTFGEFDGKVLSDEQIDQRLTHVASRLPLYQLKKRKLWPQMVAAAAVIIIVCGAILYYSLSNKASNLYANDVAPGKNGATLTLSNGQKILINDINPGRIADQSGIQISKTTDGQVIYDIKSNKDIAPGYNTLSTSRGENSQIRLPDGTVVFLNSSSSLHYPVSFAKLAKRKVFLTGEGYFEVAKDTSHPFVVGAGKQEVEVLGTHFNINYYKEEQAITTTLLEGSVKVLNGHKIAYLKPGQQSMASPDEKNILIGPADLQEAVAWKNGDFVFNGKNIKDIMNSLSRWYDVDIQYQGEITKELYYGKVSRSKNISSVLKMLERAQGVHFKIDGRRVVVMQ